MNEVLSLVKTALRLELESRGYHVATDTAGSNEGLYVRGEGDGAAALFELKPTAEEACLTMYQGSWLATAPPRFAVLPAVERFSPDVSMLLQAGLGVLLYDRRDDEVTFRELGEAVGKIRVDPAR
jgi:hypothetical protein